MNTTPLSEIQANFYQVMPSDLIITPERILTSLHCLCPSFYGKFRTPQMTEKDKLATLQNFQRASLASVFSKVTRPHNT